MAAARTLVSTGGSATTAHLAPLAACSATLAPLAALPVVVLPDDGRNGHSGGGGGGGAGHGGGGGSGHGGGGGNDCGTGGGDGGGGVTTPSLEVPIVELSHGGDGATLMVLLVVSGCGHAGEGGHGDGDEVKAPV